MNTRERIAAAWDGRTSDHVPLTTWCFGFPSPPGALWNNEAGPARYWYSLRMEHLHTLPFPWSVQDEFRRALAWRSMGVDDVLEVSVPWSADPRVSWTDRCDPPTAAEPYPVLRREYRTPGGTLRHEVRKTGEEQGEGWVIQPPVVPLIEDFNIPRAVRHVVSEPQDVKRLSFCYRPPDAAAREWFRKRMEEVGAFRQREGFPVQAWAGFGMDAVVWFCGTEGAVLFAMDYPREFQELFDIITETDLGRVELAAADPGVDLVVERGWYSSTNFWSPALLDRYLFPHVRALAGAAHRHGKKFAYVMTTGVEVLGLRLAEAGVDVLYFVDPLDPVQKGLSLDKVRALLGGSMTLVGGISSITLGTGDSAAVDRAVRQALDVLGPTGRFILHPVDALFPDTPWKAVESLIASWKKAR
ncbi:MAG TPA: uroporphyrinogen decarboxylase family protein [Spirochaetia bacterium]|nr:uroporphyrinogen decarboxylase family protein [Spirochaetia bacterium]